MTLVPLKWRPSLIFLRIWWHYHGGPGAYVKSDRDMRVEAVCWLLAGCPRVARICWRESRRC